MENKYAGADWVHRSLGIENMSGLGEKVADLLGDVFYGIYHLEVKDLKKVNWSNPHHISFKMRYRELATVDSDALTVLTVLSHDRMVRVSIKPYSRNAMEIMFHARESRQFTDPLWMRMPTMEDHVEMIRKHFNRGG